MNQAQYLRALQKLGLTPFSVKTERALGLAQRQLARLAAGTTAPSPMLQRLLEMSLALTDILDLLSDGPGGPRRLSAIEVARRALGETNEH
jgi:hypothetical protein